MKIEIFDVELGQCAMVHCPNGNIVMIDVGHNAKSNWRPSDHLQNKAIELLIISNYDEDHVSDLANLSLKRSKVKNLYLNDSVNATKLKSLKDNTGGMGDGIKTVYDWMNSPSSAGNAELGDVTIKHHCNAYETFSDNTNNLSVVTFVHYGDFTILFPGDLEVAGWEELLKKADFRKDLRKVNVLVASHHGRENGCCDDVFNYCEPQIVVISDGRIQHSTQKTQNWYGNKVLGDGVLYPDGKTRKIFTTRNDGDILIEVNLNRDWTIRTKKQT